MKTEGIRKEKVGGREERGGAGNSHALQFFQLERYNAYHVYVCECVSNLS